MSRLGLFALGSICACAKNTLLDDQLCQVYYTGVGDCDALRSEIRAEVRGSGVPTLELGNPSAPPMLFFHGWPDTAALWANQFEKFCLGKDAPFFCVAPSWIDFHPDFPRADESELFWDVQRDRFHSVVEDLGLQNITLVIFDFGAELGYQYLWQHPEVVKSVIGMDIGMSMKPPTEPLPLELSKYKMVGPLTYQRENVESFKADDDERMAKNLKTNLPMEGKWQTAPCNDCRIAPGAEGVGARTGWPYYQMIRSRKGERWLDRFATELPLEQWNFSVCPSFPEQVPFLFLYSSDLFSSGDFHQWVDGRGDGSKTVKLANTDHWLQVRVSNVTNSEMERWLFPRFVV